MIGQIEGIMILMIQPNTLFPMLANRVFTMMAQPVVQEVIKVKFKDDQVDAIGRLKAHWTVAKSLNDKPPVGEPWFRISRIRSPKYPL
jgi:hypothetical protein